MKISCLFLIVLLGLMFARPSIAQPNWPAIKANATFVAADPTYGTAYIQPLNVGGWEDGIYISRDGLNLYSTYIPVDLFSMLPDFYANPACFNFHPYYRPPLLGIDTITNPWGCPNFFQSDIVISTRQSVDVPFTSWMPSNMAMSATNEGAVAFVAKNKDSADVFVYTRDGNGTQGEDIMFMRNVPNNPTQATAVPIVQSTDQEDNPHIERLNSSTLLLLFDRARYMYYSFSYDNGSTWQTPVLITHTLNDQAPYDVQPHLYNDGTDWWVYFCADNVSSQRCIYKSKQLIPNDWDSWGPKELVLSPGTITGGYGQIFGIGEPTLTQWGDLSFVVIYGDLNSPDTTDMFDADPWLLPKIGSPLYTASVNAKNIFSVKCYPNPASSVLNIVLNDFSQDKYEIIIKNILGETILQKQAKKNENILDVSAYRDGVYFMQVTRNGSPIYNEKILVLKK